MRGRSGAALGLGAAALAASWLFGSVALAPVGIGLVVAALAARLWRRLAGREPRLARRVQAMPLVEGDTLRVGLQLERRALLHGRAVARERVGDLGTFAVPLRRGRGTLELPQIPRGRYPLGPAEVVLDDPFGLEQVVAESPAGATVVARPRVVELTTLFTDGAGRGRGGGRAAVRRPSGVDLHSLREYRDGEPLRAVHWPTTARRGQLMVRELEDPPREEVVVVLDAEASGAVGPVGASSFDEAVRVAASIARAQAARGRRVALVVAGAELLVLRVRSVERDWERALDALAGVSADGVQALPAALGDPRGPVAGRREIVVVTCGPSERALAAAPAAAVVVVDAATYAGAPPARAHPGLLRLGATGVPVAVVRRGDDLRAVLGAVASGRRSA